MLSLKDPTMVIDLYYCGTLERPSRIKEILKSGFAEEGRSLHDHVTINSKKMKYSF